MWNVMLSVQELFANCLVDHIRDTVIPETMGKYGMN